MEPMIADLALILVCAGVMTLLFKWLKQPLVLGYIVAGFVASPNMPYMPSVTDLENIHLWSDIGVIFLLFALGLEFSFKKIMKMGAAPIIAACTIILSMMMVGYTVGHAFGWGQMNSIFLGGMLAMSSTTIIFKAFDDMGLRQQRFAGMVLSVLIIEDILAIVLMVMLSTMAVSQHLEGLQMLTSIMKLVFFLVLWFVVGIYLIPILLRKVKSLMGDETMLIVSLALCLGMVVIATQVGFSPAFGAFIMGSILAETVEAERIEHLVSPVKNLFGAIFFVSVGMMVDVQLIFTYIVPILCIIAAIMIGQVVFSTAGFLLAGQPLKVAMQCSFSLTQIGEFAFILATLGTSLHVTSDFLYPIVVAVSVFTTFTTPYMIRLAIPAYNNLERHLPVRLKLILNEYTTTAPTEVQEDSLWRQYLLQSGRQVLIYGVLAIATEVLVLTLVGDLLPQSLLPEPWNNIALAATTILCASPFLYALVRRSTGNQTYKALWKSSRFNHVPMIGISLLRLALGTFSVGWVLNYTLHWNTPLVAVIATALIVAITMSRSAQRQSRRLEATFTDNLNLRERTAQQNRPKYAGRLMERDMHLSEFAIPIGIRWAGQTLAELGLGKRYDIHVASVLRGKERINIPSGKTRILPGDRLQVIGTDKQLAAFSKELEKETALSEKAEDKTTVKEMKLRRMLLAEDSPYVGQTIKDSHIREDYHCLIVGIEDSEQGSLTAPQPNHTFRSNDIVWVVGEDEDLSQLLCSLS
ncbi:MAG: cation:proton antiporter [Bacteroidaceae bacterium]|nr:cation:proton antiporter [Bacteroidaceae bacterium]